MGSAREGALEVPSHSRLTGAVSTAEVVFDQKITFAREGALEVPSRHTFDWGSMHGESGENHFR